MIPEKYKNTCPLDHSTYEKYIECNCNFGSANEVWYFKEQELQKTRERLEKKINGETSDGYHTFNELYEHRFILANALFNSDKERCLKSKKHSDGTMFDNYFIVGINTAQGWATYHYHISKWDDFKCAEIELFPEWDGHTSQDAINRIDKHFKDKQGEG